MRRLIEEVGSFFASGINRLLVTVIGIGIISVGLNIYTIKEINIAKAQTLEAIKKNRKESGF